MTGQRTDPQRIKAARLIEAHPDWCITHLPDGRWHAVHRTPLAGALLGTYLETEVTADTADALDATLAADQLRAEFPDWEIIRTDRGRWWAVPNEAGRASKRARTSVDADTSDELRAALRDATRPTAPHRGRCTQ